MLVLTVALTIYTIVKSKRLSDFLDAVSDERLSALDQDQVFLRRLAMSETELKYQVPAAAAAAVDASLRRHGARAVRIESRYYDSSDGRLAAAAISLRLRKAGGRWEQTVKAPGRHALDRLEETTPRPGRWARAGPPIDPSLHDGTAAGAALASALRGDGSVPAALELAYTSIVRRRALEATLARARVEIAFDRGAILAGELSEPICEVEYELKRGAAAALVELARAGIAAHGLWLSTLSKSARGDALARRGGRHAAVKAQAPALRKDMAPAALRRALLKVCFEQVGANASVLASGQLDDEVVHQLRVGLRRLRTVARELMAEGGAPPDWDAPLTQAFRALGEYRDSTTVAAAISERLAAAGSPDPVLRAPGPEPIDPVALVRGGDFQVGLLGVVDDLMVEARPTPLDAVAVDPGAPLPATATRAVDTAAIATRLDALHAGLKKAAKRFASLDDLRRHEVRKRLKRLRYLAELIGPVYRQRAVERYLEKLRPAQDELGAYVDNALALRLARERVEAGDARAWFNVGWLRAQVPRGVKRCRRALAQAALARPFWTAARR